MGRTLGLSAALAMTLGGCSTLGYYWQAVNGHVGVMQARRPVSKLLTSGEADPRLRRQLELSEDVLRFARGTIGLPDNDSYRQYADLDRRYVVWNVVATPELSLTPKTWCMPVAGCVSYRGFFAEEDAQTLAAALRADGLETSVRGVAAYSTLGWFADPLLNTMLYWPDDVLAETLIHELAHQQLYVQDDTGFNEAYATAVAEIGLDQYQRHTARLGDAAAIHRRRERRRQFVGMILDMQTRLGAVYAGDLPDATKRQQKAALYAQLQRDYARLKQQWGGYAGYDDWMAGVNNARLVSVANYHRLVPAFIAAFEAVGRHWPDFHARMREVAALDAEQRQAWLDRQLAHTHDPT